MAKIRLSGEIKKTYSELVPMLSGKGSETWLTLLGRRRDDPTVLDTVLTRSWKPGEPISISWQDDALNAPSPTLAPLTTHSGA